MPNTTPPASSRPISSRADQRRGRPAKAPGMLRNKRVVFLLTETEFENAQSIAGPGNVNALAKSRFMNPRGKQKKSIPLAFDQLKNMLDEHAWELQKLATTDKNKAALAAALDSLEQLASAADRVGALIKSGQ